MMAIFCGFTEIIFGIYKGKIENNESITDAALREVKEECGLKGMIEISHKIIVTHHTYHSGMSKVLKKTSGFSCISMGRQILFHS